MKLNICYLFVLLVSISCNSQEKDATLQKAISQLEESIASMSEAISFYEEPPAYNPSVTLTNGIILNEPTKQDSIVSRSKITTYLDSITFSEKIEYPGNYLELNYDRYDYKKILSPRDPGFLRNAVEPIFKINNITYKNSRAEKRNDTIDYVVSSFEKGIKLSNSKPVKELAVTASYTFPEVRKISLREDKLSVKFPEGTLTLKLLEDSIVYFVVPTAFKERIVDVIAYGSSGNPLEKDGFYSESSLTEQDINYFKESIPLYESALKKIDKQEFQNIDELTAYMVEKLPKEPTQVANTFTMTYRFKNDIAVVDLFLSKNNNLLTEHTMVIKDDTYNKTRFNFFAARDTISNKMGFVGLDGTWKKPPVFNGLRYENDFYYSAMLEDKEVFIALDVKNDTFKVVDYRVIDTEIYHNKLVIFQKDSELGVRNVENQNVLIPASYRAIDHQYGLFHVVTQDQTEGVYNKDGKVILPATYYMISIFEDKIQAQTKVNGGDDIYEEFDFKGNKIGSY